MSEEIKGRVLRALIWPIAFHYFKRDLRMGWRQAWRATHRWVWGLEWVE